MACPLDASPRRRVNILVTGTPGTGKTSFAAALAIRDKGFHAEARDEEFDAFVLDEESEDRLVDDMDERLSAGGAVVDFHSSDFFPERWFDRVVVLRCDSAVLYDRLLRRGYSERKVRENVEAEIFQVCLEEVRDAYAADIIDELPSNTPADLSAAVERTLEWLRTREGEDGAES